MALPAAMALSGLNGEQFGTELKNIHIHGAKLLRTPSSQSLTSNGTTSSLNSLESGISSMTPSSSNDTYWDFLIQLDELMLEEGTANNLEKRQDVAKEVVIMYNKRDILDLGLNITAPPLVTLAALPTGAAGFLSNRSQYSRVNGNYFPRYNVLTCNCGFEEPQYL